MLTSNQEYQQYQHTHVNSPKCMDSDSAPSAATTGITLICPEVATRSITLGKPILILCLPPTCSTTSPHFHLPPPYETQALTVNISLNTANLNIINISSLDFHI